MVLLFFQNIFRSVVESLKRSKSYIDISSRFVVFLRIDWTHSTGSNVFFVQHTLLDDSESLGNEAISVAAQTTEAVPTTN